MRDRCEPTQSGKADQIRSRDGYDHIDHSIVQNYGENRNLVIRPGDNIYVDDPGIDFEYVLANLSTLLHSGKVDSVLSDSSLVKGNGRPTSLTHDIFGNPRPSPTDSRPDIGPFESADDRVINPVAPTTLIHPSTGAMDVDRRTSFSWGEVRYATTYRFEISKDPFFIDKDVSMNVRDTSILFETPLDADQTYYWRIKAFNSGVEGDWSPTWSFTTGVQTSVEADGDIPEAYSLEQNYPNPFNPTTMIRFTLPIASDVTLEVFNSTGQRVSVLLDGYIPAGTHSVAFDAEGLSSGVYLYRLISRHGILSGIMNKVK